MLKSQRQNEILDILKKENFVTVTDLANRLYSSLPTVRRDLNVLEAEGYIKRCHGGAMILEGEENTPIYFRRERNAKEKIMMCRVAAELINDRDVIFVDASSTVFHISDFLEEKKEITVVTNSHLAAQRFLEKNMATYCTGGRLLKESFVYAGYAAETAASLYNADIMFFSAASLSDEGMISDWSDDERSMRAVMNKSTKTSVFMCDSSKIGKVSAFKLFGLDYVDYFVTDSPVSEELCARFDMSLVVSEPACLYKIGIRAK